MPNPDIKLYQKVLAGIFLRIKEVFPFQNKKEFLAMAKRFELAKIGADKISNDLDFLFYLKDFIASLRHSHLRLSYSPSWPLYRPKNFDLVLNKNYFYLRQRGIVIGRVLLIDGIKPDIILRKSIEKSVGSTRQYLLSQGLKNMLLSRESRPVEIGLEVGRETMVKKIPRQTTIIRQCSKNNIEAKLINKKTGYLKIIAWVNDEVNIKKMENKINFFAAKNISSLVIDLRGNSGGSSKIADILAGHFVGRKTLFGINKRRVAKNNFKLKKFYYYIYPQEPYLDVALYILTDSQSFSSSELFIAGLEDNGIAKIVGATTGGGTGNPREFPLKFKNHSLRLFVPTWDYYRINGQRIEGAGIKPNMGRGLFKNKVAKLFN